MTSQTGLDLISGESAQLNVSRTLRREGGSQSGPTPSFPEEEDLVFLQESPTNTQ